MAMVFPKDVLAEVLKADAGRRQKVRKTRNIQRRTIKRFPALAGLCNVG